MLNILNILSNLGGQCGYIWNQLKPKLLGNNSEGFFKIRLCEVGRPTLNLSYTF